MSDVFTEACRFGVLPVIAIEDAAHAIPLADALAEGGLPVAEVTFRTRAAAEVMAKMTAERPDFLVGAGTVLDLDWLAAAKASGAKFGLAPVRSCGGRCGAEGRLRLRPRYHDALVRTRSSDEAIARRHL